MKPLHTRLSVPVLAQVIARERCVTPKVIAHSGTAEHVSQSLPIRISASSTYETKPSTIAALRMIVDVHTFEGKPPVVLLNSLRVRTSGCILIANPVIAVSDWK